MSLRSRRGEEDFDHESIVYGKGYGLAKSRGGSDGGHYGKLLAVVLVLGYVALFFYFRTITSMREVETRIALQTLENSFVNVESEMKLMAHELEDRQSLLSEKQKAIEERDALILRMENKVKNFEKVEERLSQNVMVQALQKQNRIFNYLRWGNGPIRVLFEMSEGQGEIEIETAPLDLMPHTVHYFLTMVEAGFWDGCHVVRNAAHVMQLNCNLRVPRHKKEPSLVFQEYSDEFKHMQWTLGVAGRPGGPDHYWNLRDNIETHGPGGQGPEADPCFARIIRGTEVVEALHNKLPPEWLDKTTAMQIRRATILNASPQGRAGLPAVEEASAQPPPTSQEQEQQPSTEQQEDAQEQQQEEEVEPPQL